MVVQDSANVNNIRLREAVGSVAYGYRGEENGRVKGHPERKGELMGHQPKCVKGLAFFQGLVGGSVRGYGGWEGYEVVRKS